jgi:NAD(P)-dependent dehydrogenase (short-subunit alcohol dehydrogenase family)
VVAAKELAAAGASVIVPVRDVGKAEQRLAAVPELERGTLELIDPASIDSFAGEFLASGRPLHLLINNAGIMAGTAGARWRRQREPVRHTSPQSLPPHRSSLAGAAQGQRGACGPTLLPGARAAGIDFDDQNFHHWPCLTIVLPA